MRAASDVLTHTPARLRTYGTRHAGTTSTRGAGRLARRGSWRQSVGPPGSLLELLRYPSNLRPSLFFLFNTASRSNGRPLSRSLSSGTLFNYSLHRALNSRLQTSETNHDWVGHWSYYLASYNVTHYGLLILSLNYYLFIPWDEIIRNLYFYLLYLLLDLLCACNCPFVQKKYPRLINFVRRF